MRFNFIVCLNHTWRVCTAFLKIIIVRLPWVERDCEQSFFSKKKSQTAHTFCTFWNDPRNWGFLRMVPSNTIIKVNFAWFMTMWEYS